ncbi:MAG: SUMF1/EgtB/PvdO family nonheme iron enzyme [Deltaproteobacteria bacterium]|nr:SUMF1/EgtB/PvdO family nonheme iron enzyme [Deltaproteobacteria bacterium]
MPSEMRYYALIIGSNNYKNLPKLKTAINDAKEVERILKSQYGFETKLLIDATRNEILTSINDFRKKLGSNDNLLIYYAGHGVFDKTADRAYWLPVNAQKDDPVDWISATDITDNIKRIASNHILIISDSCYSGTLTRAAAADLSTKGDRSEYIKKMLERPSRTLMASGGNEPVADSGGGGHSIFASAFLKALKEADKNYFTAEELFHGRVKEIVAGKSDQVPEYNDIRNSGHEGGDFVFMAKTYLPAKPSAKPLPADEPPLQMQEPGKPKFSLEDIEKEAEQKKKEQEKNKIAWNMTLKDMKDAFNQVMEYQKRDIDADSKIAALNKFLDSFPEKNPYSDEDEAMRKKANEQIAMAKKPKGGAPYTDPATGMEFVFVKGGCFQMGNTFGDGESDEKPVHEVCVDDFYMGKYEVTQKEWKAIMGNNPSLFKDCGDNCPVEKVSWNDVQEYINKLNLKSPFGKGGQGGFRLPTEAEWEYAARSGGKNERYAGGNNIDSVAWYTGNSGNKTHPVGQKEANGLGLYDMSGNVWEWCQDRYDNNYYKSSPRDNPKGASSDQLRVLRGGSWLYNEWHLRADYRDRYSPDLPYTDGGFRLGVSSVRQ